MLRKQGSNVDNTEELRCISLCSGYGGLDMGLKRAWPSVRTVAYVEIEAFAVANLVAKMEEDKLDAAPIWTNLKTFDGEPFRNRVHIITAGYPCQPFSVAGQRKGTDDPRHLWPYIARIVEAVEPVLCFFENVGGHLTMGFPEVYRSLRNMGYSVEAGLFTAAEVGSPHRRQRLFILGKSPSYGFSATTLKRSIREAVPNHEEGQNPTSKSQGTDIARKLADTSSEGLQGRQRTRGIDEERRQEQARPATQRSQLWPARPGQPQYEWEEPRVVLGHRKTGQESMADTENGRRSGTINKRDESENAGQGKDERCNVVEPLTSKSEGQAEPCVGRAVNGPSRRVDRLRLLGNGVVPQCAEKAIRTLGALFE